MSSSSRTLLRTFARASQAAVRPAPARSARNISSSRRCMAETSAAAAAASPKIQGIIDSISSLTLLEVSELVTGLKTRLNITEIAMPSAAAAPAASAASTEPAEAEAEKPKEKTIFTVKLEAIDPANKAKVIREVKAMMPNMNLVEAKKFVESVPQTLKENLPKEEAEKLRKTMEALGATITMS